MNNVNLISTIESKITTIPDEKTCLRLLREYVSDNIYNNHKQLLKENGILDVRSSNDMYRSISNLFLTTYVDENWHGCGRKKLHDLIRNQLPEYHQIMQYLGTLYSYSRHNRLFC